MTIGLVVVAIAVLVLGMIRVARLDTERIARRAAEQLPSHSPDTIPKGRLLGGLVVAASFAACGLGILFVASGPQMRSTIPETELRELTVSAATTSAATTETSLTEIFGPPQTYYGYYGDLNPEGNQTLIKKEVFKLQFAKNSLSLQGEMSGDVFDSRKNVMTHRTWQVQGFRRPHALNISFLTLPTESDTDVSGLGTIYLEENDSGYTGTAVYKDCIHRFVQCPYALSRDDVDENVAKTRWPKLFGRPCEKIDLSPDFPSVAWTTC